MSQDKNVIIIGNGVSAILNENGNKIDKFHEVWRFYPSYNPEIEYQKFIGSKTTGIILKTKEKYKEAIETKVKPFCKKNNIIFIYRHEIKQTELCIKYCKKFGLTNKLRSGLLLIFNLLETYACVYLHGFDIVGFKEKKEQERGYQNGVQHFWGGFNKSNCHDPKIESKIIKELQKDGKVLFL